MSETSPPSPANPRTMELNLWHVLAIVLSSTTVGGAGGLLTSHGVTESQMDARMERQKNEINEDRANKRQVYDARLNAVESRTATLENDRVNLRGELTDIKTAMRQLSEAQQQTNILLAPLVKGRQP